MEMLLYWLIAANFIGFALMLWDKARAEAGGWRVAESTLISWSLIGGSIGTIAASHLVRHKTRKQPIAMILRVIPVGHAALACAAMLGLFDPLASALTGG